MEKYQLDYSLSHPSVLDPSSREKKYRKMISVIRDYYGGDLSSLNCLEIGASGGVITALLSNQMPNTIGLDIDASAIHSANSILKNNANYIVGDGLNLPFKDQSLDLIICNHVYEHVPNANQLFNEIYRTLKNDGFCYVAAANRLAIIEGHYFLPFLSWLPKPVAHRYLRLTGKGYYYYEIHLSYIGLRKLLKDFNIIDYTLDIIYNPKKFAAEEMVDKHPITFNIVSRTPKSILRILYYLVPTYIFILTKRSF